MAFKTKIVISRFSAEQVSAIGTALQDSIIARIRRGQTVEDAPAKPLSDRYRMRKLKIGASSIRDWKYRKDLLSALQVNASENSGTLAFNSPGADYVAHVLNTKQKMFGISPKDREVLDRAVMNAARSGQNARFGKGA